MKEYHMEPKLFSCIETRTPGQKLNCQNPWKSKLKASKNSFPSIGYDLGPKFESEMHFLLTKVGIFQNFHKDMCLDYFLFESGMPKRIFWGMLDVLRFKIVDFGHLTFTIRWNLDIGEISDTSVKYWEICNSEGTFISETLAVFALRVGIEEILKFRSKMNEQMSVCLLTRSWKFPLGDLKSRNIEKS